MHPALSVIVFTTLSGAGYGLMAWVGLAFLAAAPDAARPSVTGALVLALLLVTLGLLSSLAHLGQPQRAWRAFSQWRSSWLSREGVAAVLAYVPAGWLLARAGVAPGALDAVLGGALILLALATVTCTAMIYASLVPVPAWRHRAVVPVYLGFALLCGGLAWAALGAGPAPGLALVLGACAALLAALKWRYWRDIDADPALPPVAAAVGLPGREVSVFERPHTEANYLTREMGFVLARRHAVRLRRIALVLFAGVPVLALALVALAPALPALALNLAAALAALLGAAVERWLFFAQARHMVMQYYGSPR